jgi:hypothetical protein
MAEKLVTIYLDSHAYMGGKWIKGTFSEQHGLVEQHLQEYLDSGWRIKEVHSLGGADANTVRGWIVVHLEKN